MGPDGGRDLTLDDSGLWRAVGTSSREEKTTMASSYESV